MTLYDEYMAFRATLGIPETHAPLTTVPPVTGTRKSKEYGRSVKRQGWSKGAVSRRKK